MTGPAASERHDVVLRWLDHQIIGPHDELLGNVDDLELLRDGTDWLVTGVMVGPAALSQRLPGRLGSWTYAVWRRLHPAAHPAAVVIPIEHVIAVDSAVHVDQSAAQALTSSFGLELWLREHVISRLPGATDSSSREDTSPTQMQKRPRSAGDQPQAPARAPRDGAHAVSEVIGRTVHDTDGAVAGRVSELRCVGRPRESVQAALQVQWVLYTRHLTGSELGYSIDRRQGPALVRLAARTWQRHDRAVQVEHLDGLDTPDGVLRIRAGAHLQHPHDVGDIDRHGPATPDRA